MFLIILILCHPSTESITPTFSWKDSTARNVSVRSADSMAAWRMTAAQVS
jgi:hypothetical protein